MRKLPYLLLSSALAACMTGDSSDEASQVASDLTKTNGGETTADEMPVFADEAAFDAMGLEADAEVADSMAQDPGIAAIANLSTAESRRVLIAWGRMPVDPNATTGRDWSGSLRLSRGALLVNRRIGFEPATDRVLPRLERERVAFQSVTRPFADGLVLRVIADSAATGALTLTYESAVDPSITYAFDLGQLANGPISIDAGDGNRVVAIALRDRPDRPDCQHGFMRGRWHALQSHAHVGVYRGVVHGDDGRPVGHVRGIYGERASGEKVMFGKFIDRDGKFVGLINGSYDNGELRAKWIARDGDHGTLHGRYFEGATDRAGGFVARWADASCTED